MIVGVAAFSEDSINHPYMEQVRPPGCAGELPPDLGRRSLRRGGRGGSRGRHGERSRLQLPLKLAGTVAAAAGFWLCLCVKTAVRSTFFLY